ncbi:MAG: hypothetical protein INR62_06200 [Rhodospirillales bacterium]|nr:hypothetical protein [Acetobacter sp.]
MSVLAAAKQGHLLAALRGKWAALRMWRSLRRSVEAATATRTGGEAVAQIVRRSEGEIRSLQQTVGFDPYWRLYFGLVRS